MEGETLRSVVGEEVAVVVVLTELAAGGDVRHLGEGGEEVVRSDDAGLVLQVAAPSLLFSAFSCQVFVQTCQHPRTLLLLPFVFSVNIRAATASPAMYMSTDVENYRHHNNFPRHSGECRNKFDIAYQATELLYRIPTYGLTGEKRSTVRLSSQYYWGSGGPLERQINFFKKSTLGFSINYNLTNDYVTLTYARLNWPYVLLRNPDNNNSFCDEVIV